VKNVDRLPDTTKVSKLGFTPAQLKGVSPKVQGLTRADLIALVVDPVKTPEALNLSFKDLQGLQGLAAKAAKTTTGGGGSGDGGIRCCCCIACCCCCCAVAVSEPELVAQF
jgi:hypothetical protein